jgi:hypothetical protein
MNGNQVARRENEHVGHAATRAASKGGSAEGVFAGGLHWLENKYSP